MTPTKTTAEANGRVSAWEWAQVTILVVNLTWTTLCFGGFLPEAMVVTSALNAALLIVHLFGRVFAGEKSGGEVARLFRVHPAGWWLLPFLAYAAINAQWVTSVPWLGWRDWLNWVQLTIVFWVVLNGVRMKRARLVVFCALVSLGIVEVLLAAYQSFVAPDWLMLGRTQVAQFLGRSSGTFGSPNSLAAFLIMMLPVLGMLTIRPGATAAQRVLWGYLTLVFGLALVLTMSRGGWLALAAVIALGPLVMVQGSWQRRMGVTFASWLSLGALAVALYATVPTVRDRVDQLQVNRGELSRPGMWRAAWKIFEEHPVFGGGAGSYGVRFDRYRPETFQLEARWAHNDYLNTLSDYGGIGALLCFGAWAVMAARGGRARSPITRDWFDGRAVTVGLWLGSVAFALQLLVDFSLKIPALAMTFSVLTAMLVQREWPPPAPVTHKLHDARRIQVVVAAVGIAVATAMFVVPLYRGESIRQEARNTIDRMGRQRLEPSEAVMRAARDRLKYATQISPANGNAWADLSYATALLVRFDPSRTIALGREAEDYAERALGCSAKVAEFWIRRAVALDLQGRWSEAGAALVQALALAPAKASVWYQQAVHLSMDEADPGRALAAASFSLRLDPGNPEAHALRERLAERSRAR